MSANNKSGVGSGSGEWRTPPALFAVQNRRWKFNFDLFASNENALCRIYATPEGAYVMSPTVGDMRVSDHDGLTCSVPGLRVWANPPYTRRLIDSCIDSMIARAGDVECMSILVPAATETGWFRRAYAAFGEPIWLPRRVKFIDPRTGIPGASPPSGMCIFESRVTEAEWLGALA